jgi:RHS repeat-associated protein
MEFNWDNRLREATVNDTSVLLKYDPDGNRIYKDSDDGQTVTKRKYIVGEVGGLHVILLEINPDNNNEIVKSYIYAQDDLVAQYDGDQTSGDKYFYICDRLGNIRQVIDVNASVQYLYAYGPFGKVLESDEDADPPDNAFRFTGQYYDADLDQYYLRARQYSPDLSRFTARDPISGDFEEPFSLHAYPYTFVY